MTTPGGYSACTRCGETKPQTDFYSRGPSRGRETFCKACSVASKTARYRDRKAGLIPTEYVESQECGDCGVMKSREAFGVDHARRCGLKLYCNDCVLVRWRRGRYGLTQEQNEALGDACAICGRTERLVVDHDHTSGEVRGRLCDPCNVGLGRFQDDPDRLLAAAAYLLQRADVLGSLS